MTERLTPHDADQYQQEETDVRIRRSRLTGDFLQVPNATVRDDRLSHMARGILVELLSRPDGWEATADDMWRASVDKHGKGSPGRRQFRAAFAELKECGYLTADRELLKGGRYGTVLTLADVPHGGTSERPAETRKASAQTDVPQAGTSEGLTDVPQGGTPESPAETTEPAGRTDVPPTDVPHAGTSKRENGVTKTEEKTGTTAADAAAAEVALFAIDNATTPARKPRTRKPSTHPVADELCAAFWEHHGRGRAQPFIAVRSVIRAAIGNGVERDELARALDTIAREGRSISGATIDIALGAIRNRSALATDPRPSTTDQRVNQALEVGRRLQALADAQAQEHQ